MHRSKNLFPCLIAGLLALPSFALGMTYTAIKGESQISYHLHHPMHEIEGASKDFDCTMDLAGDTTHAKVHVKAKIENFNSGNSSRDSHMMEVTDAMKYPFVEFTSDSVRHETLGYRVFGNLTFHGVKRSIDFIVVPTYAKDRIDIRGGFTVRLSDYKVERPALLFVKTADELKMELDVVVKGP